MTATLPEKMTFIVDDTGRKLPIILNTTTRDRYGLNFSGADGSQDGAYRLQKFFKKHGVNPTEVTAVAPDGSRDGHTYTQILEISIADAARLKEFACDL